MTVQGGITRKWTDKNGVIADISCQVSCFCTSNTLILLSAITGSAQAEEWPWMWGVYLFGMLISVNQSSECSSLPYVLQ